MTRLLLTILILALMPNAHAHNARGCEWLLESDLQAMQRQVWRLEAQGQLNEAAAVRIQLDTWLGNTVFAKIEELNIGYNSKPQLAGLPGGARAVFKTAARKNEAHSPRHEIAAVIVNEELGYPVRIPSTVWRRYPEAGSLQLWIDAKVVSEDVASGDLKLFDFLIDNFDRISSNRLMDPEFGSIAIDHAGAFGDFVVTGEWTNLGNLKFSCVHPLFEQKIHCVTKMLEGFKAKARLDWRERLNNLDVDRVIKRLDLWVEPQMLENFRLRICVLKALLNEKNPGECGTTPGRA